ncbi:response regulator [Actinoplanes missouriensis]|uniref:response regulator n=1 Tax=Actinoplanes missouriensis TaxID=1866 RepID=UPI0005A05196|nr:response regulator transcription factor [Actinoplanes missouriensis]
MEPHRYEVLVVDDHPVFRRGLTTLLSYTDWVSAVHEATTGAEALQAVTGTAVDVVALDLRLPDIGGLEVARQMLRIRPEVRIVVLTMADDDETVRGALRSGVHGYLLKEQDPDQVLAALRSAAAGGFTLGPRIGAAVLHGIDSPARTLPPPLDTLTPRELELMAHLAAGHDNAYIARRLGIADKTVRNQMSDLFLKIGVPDRVRAALLAREAGIPPAS